MQFALRRIIASGIFLCCGCEAPTAVQPPPAGLPAGSAPATSGSPTRSTAGSVSDNGSDAQAAKPALQVTRLPAQELDQGWISLFDGQTMFGWEAGSTANWQVQEGVLVVSEGEKGLLCTTSEFSDYMLRLEFRFAAGTNSGVFLHTPFRPTNPAVDCYELNIAEASVSEFSTGSFVNRQKTEVVAAPDAWHEFEVTMDGGHATVKLNGDLALDYTDPRPLGRGKIALQLNQGRVEFRNLRIRPLQLVSLFNGKDLAGWTETPARA